MIKQRQESLDIYQKAGRNELADQEREEIEIISAYLPKQMSDIEAASAISALIKEIEAETLKDMGRTMAALKQRFAGRMDFGKAGAHGEEAARRRLGHPVDAAMTRRILVGLVRREHPGIDVAGFVRRRFRGRGNRRLLSSDGHRSLAGTRCRSCSMRSGLRALPAPTSLFRSSRRSFRCSMPWTRRRAGRRGQHRRDCARWPLHRLQFRSARAGATASMKASAAPTPRTATVVQIGAGGAGRAVAFALDGPRRRRSGAA